jgi:hypothetical protein
MFSHKTGSTTAEPDTGLDGASSAPADSSSGVPAPGIPEPKKFFGDPEVGGPNTLQQFDFGSVEDYLKARHLEKFANKFHQ